MLLKCSVLLCIIVVGAHAASLQQRSNIPVRIVYDEPLPFTRNLNSVRNLNEKIQLPLQEENQQKINSVRNLDAKVQLRSNDFDELFLTENDQSSREARPSPAELSLRNLDAKVQLSQEELSQPIKLEEKPKLEEAPKLESLSLLEQAQKIVSSGLEAMRKQFANVSFKTPSKEAWDDLEKSLDNFFQAEKAKIGVQKENTINLKQGQGGTNQNVVQLITNGIQNITNNFVSNFQGEGGNNNTNQGDEGTNVFQNFISGFQGGVQSFVNNINTISGQGSSTSNTVLGDNGVSTTPSSNVISNIVSNVQQFFGINQGNNATQGDTGTGTQGGPQQFIQTIGNQIGTVFNNIVQGGSSSPPPGVSGDDPTSTTQRNPIQVIQAVGTQIGTAFNQFIGQTSKPDGASGDTGVTPAPPGNNFVQTIGTAIQNLNPFRPNEKPAESPSTGSTGGNPIIAGVQNVGSQVQQLVGSQNASNPVESIQNAISGVTAGSGGDKPVKEDEKKPVEKTNDVITPEQPAMVDNQQKLENEEVMMVDQKIQSEKKPEEVVKVEPEKKVEAEKKPETMMVDQKEKLESEKIMMMEQKEKIESEKKPEEIMMVAE